jgi:general secretion pathway protein D
VLILPLEAAVEGMVTRNYPVNAGAIKTVLATPAAAGGAAAGADTYRAFGTGGSGVTMTAGGDVKALFAEAGVPFPPGSSIVYNERTSMLIVRNTPENLETFERVLAAFNVVPSQVEIEAKFVDVSQNDLDELGFNWTVGAMQFGHYNSSAGRREFQLDGVQSQLRDAASANLKANALESLLSGGSSTLLNQIGSISGILTEPSVQVIITALSQKSSTDLLSAPKVTTISGQQAQIRVVQEFIYPSRYREPQVVASGGGSTGSGAVGVTPSTPEEFKTREVGVLLNVTPTASPDGNTINLTLVPEVSEFLGFLDYSSPFAVSSGGSVLTSTNIVKQPLFQSRNLTTSIVIWDGQTVVLGGLLREDVKQINDKIPFLGDIPWLGRLFQSKATQRTKRNLLIFVTARLVDPAGNPIHRAGIRPGL